MKVFVVTYWSRYESCAVQSMFKNLDSAEKFVEAQKQNVNFIHFSILEDTVKE